MSKTVRNIVSIALPIAAVALPFLAPAATASIGGALGVGAANAGLVGSALTGAALSGAGSAIGGKSVGQSLMAAGLGGLGGALGGGGLGAELAGAAGLEGTAANVASGALSGAAYGGASGGAKGALQGAVLGGIGGGLMGGGETASGGVTGNEPISAVSSTGAPMTTTANMSSIPSGAVAAGGAARAAAPATSASLLSNPLVKGGVLLGTQLMAGQEADAAKEAAGIQSASVDRALQAQSPYQQAGTDALKQIQTIQADPAGYIQNNPLYSSLAADAERRLLANQAAKGKVGSGGTASALQDQLLQIGNGLVQQQLGNLNTTASMGQGATNQVSNLLTSQGAANAAGVVGAQNATSGGFQNSLSTLLALQNLNRAQSYTPTATRYV